MTLTSLLNQTVLITRRLPSADRDDYGNDQHELTVVETVGYLWQQQTREPALEGEESVSQFRLVLPAGTEITTADEVVIDGHEYEVTGEPWLAYNPRLQRVAQVEVPVTRVAGAGDSS